MEPFTFRNKVNQNRFQPVTKQGIISIKLSQAGKDYQVAKGAVKEAPDIRMDLVNDIKERLANGTYNVSDEDLADK